MVENDPNQTWVGTRKRPVPAIAGVILSACSAWYHGTISGVRFAAFPRKGGCNDQSNYDGICGCRCDGTRNKCIGASNADDEQHQRQQL